MLFAPSTGSWVGSAGSPAFAETPNAVETQAFEDAKALATVEAWDAFLAHYPTGFHADLARAYVKQLANTPVQSPAPHAGPEQPAYEQTCEGQETLRSRESQEPAKLRFINESGVTIVLQWIDFKGARKEYATLAPGAEITQDTFITHPWVAAYQEGSCRQMFLPAPGLSVARLRPQAELAHTPPPAKQPARTKSSDGDDPPLKCGKNSKKSGGKCVPLQTCGANASRSSEGFCACNKGYRMQNGQCIVKRAEKCSRHEVYSSSMGQCIPKAAMCEKNEVYSSSMAQCIPKSLGQ